MVTASLAFAILKGTPLWVWVVLGYLIVRGIRAMRPSATSFAGLSVIPAIFVIWGIWSIYKTYDGTRASVILWLVAFALGSSVGYVKTMSTPIHVDRERQLIISKGGPATLVTILLLFCLQYALNVTAVLRPEARSDFWFMLVSIGMAGIAGGLLTGRVVGLREQLKRPASTKTAAV